MKVLHLISSGGMYGAEAVILNVSRAMQEAGHPSILGVFHNSARPNLQVHEAAAAAGLESHLMECTGQVDRQVPERIRQLVRGTGADVLHAHGYKADVYSWLALRRSGTPLISTCHNWLDTDLFVRAYGAADRRVLRSFAGVIAVSEQVRQRLIGAGVPSAKVHLIANGIDLKAFAAAAERPADQDSHRHLTIGVVGRLSPEKGLPVFLEAAARVAAEFPGTRFALVGDGPDRAALEALAGKLEIALQVEFWGRQQDMPAVYASLDMLVLSSLYEGLPMVLLEAMASRLPVVATAVGDIPSVLDHGKAGVVVPPGNAGALAEAMLDLLCHPERRDALADAGYNQVRKNFSAAKTAEAYMDLYRSVLPQEFRTAATA